MRIKKYEITVLGKDINILCNEELQYATLFGLRGLQCNFPPESEQYRTLDRKLGELAKTILEIDGIIDEGEHLHEKEEGRA